MAEQLICNQQVVGSTPITSSIKGTSFVYQGKGVSLQKHKNRLLAYIKIDKRSLHGDNKLWTNV